MTNRYFGMSERSSRQLTPIALDAAEVNRLYNEEMDRQYVATVFEARATGFLNDNSFKPGGYFYKANDLPPPQRSHF